MSDVDWRIWIWDRLRNNQDVLDQLPNGEFDIYGAGSLIGPPDNKPFLVIHIGEEFREFQGMSRTIATIWAHDDTGNYNAIDTLLFSVRNALCGYGESIGSVLPPPSKGIVCAWNSNGPDQADEALKTLMRNSTYQLIGRDGND